MKTENLELITKLRNMMEHDNYPINDPVSESFLNSMMRKSTSSASIGAELESISNDIVLLLVAQPDYVDFLENMDGFEYDGLILYSFSVKSEGDKPPVNNIFLYNDNFRFNDIYSDPNLSERIVIGQDSISLFTYDFRENIFQIRDNVGTENVFGSFSNFTDFLSDILDTVA